MILRPIRWVAAAIGVLAVATGCSGGSDDAQTARPSASASAITSAATPDIEAPAGWEARIASMAPNGEAGHNAGLTIQVVGTCASNNGEGMLLKGSGFPPNGSYVQKVLKPDGDPYGYLDPNGRFDKLGNPSGWSWDCDDTGTGEHDPPGVYTLIFKDTTPGSPTQYVKLSTKFTVSY